MVLHHCQRGMGDLSLGCKINFKTVFFATVNLSVVTFVQFFFFFFFLSYDKVKCLQNAELIGEDQFIFPCFVISWIRVLMSLL